MADIKQGRWTAEIEGDFVVFIIGARLNSKWQAFRSFADLGGRRGMNHMLKYLTEHPEKGLLGYETMGFANVQYWRSFEHLEAFAKDTDDPHLGPGPGAITGSASARTRVRGSGTRPTLCATASTRRSMGTCRRVGSARPAASCRSPNRLEPANDSRPRLAARPDISRGSRHNLFRKLVTVTRSGSADVGLDDAVVTDDDAGLHHPPMPEINGAFCRASIGR